MGDVDGPPTREYLLQPLRGLIGRQITDVRLVSDDVDTRLVEDPDAEDGVRVVRRGEPGFETNEIKLCLDDGKEIHLDLMSFRVTHETTSGPFSSLEEMLASPGFRDATPETREQIRKKFGPSSES